MEGASGESSVIGEGRRGTIGCGGVLGCPITEVSDTGMDKQYLRCKSAASLTSPTVLLLRASTMLVHVGAEGEVFSHVLRVSLRQCEGSSYCSLMASSVPTLIRSCKPILYHFARTSFNSSITTNRSLMLSCWPAS